METETIRFEELKKVILERARAAEACREQYGRAYKAGNIDELMEVVRDNFQWCCNNGVIDGELIDRYKTEFNECKIWHNEDASEGCLLASGSATVRASGSATVEAYDSATVRAYDSATVRAYDSATVEAYDSATVRAYDSAYICSWSAIECQLNDHSIYRIEETNEVRYVDENIKFVKVKEAE